MRNERAKALAAVLIALALAGGFSIQFSDNVEAAFIEPFTVPWDSQFIPNDSAWDASGNYCLVVGNDTASTPDENVWTYRSGGSNWTEANSDTISVPLPDTINVGSGAGNDSATIQGGVNLAASGDTVFVWPGTYTESVSVAKSIRIQGYDRSSTLINLGAVSGNGFYVTSAEVNITGFSIQNAQSPSAGIYFIGAGNSSASLCEFISNYNAVLVQDSDAVGLQNNIVTSNGFGFYLYDSDFCEASGNSITGSTSTGLHVQTCDRTTLENNFISGNNEGIYVEEYCDSNSIMGNSIVASTLHGLCMSDVTNSNIVDNSVTGSGEYGVRMMNDCTGNVFTQNYLYNNNRGFWTTSGASVGNQVYQNDFLMATLAVVYDMNAGLNSYYLGDPASGGKGGNYYGNVAIVDRGDGICANPYGIGSGGSLDQYPWFSPSGWASYFNKRVDQNELSSLVNIVTTNEQLSSQIAIGPDGSVNVVWQDRRSGNYDIYFAKSTDGGKTYLFNTKVSNDPGTAEQSSPKLAVDTAGVIYVVWQDKRVDVNGDIFFSKSFDGGLSFASNMQLTSSSSQESWPSVAVFSNYIYVVWHQYSGVNFDIMCSVSSNGGGVWGAFIRVDHGGPTDTQTYPSLAADSSGYVYVAWNDNRLGAWDVYYTKSTNFGASFDSPDVRVNDNNVNDQLYPQVKVNSAGVHIVWQDYRNSASFPDIYYSRSTDFGLTWGTNRKVNSGTGVANTQPTIALASDGTIYCVWVKNSNLMISKSHNSVYFAADKLYSQESSSKTSPSIACGGSSDLYCTYDYPNEVLCLRYTGTCLAIQPAINLAPPTGKVSVMPGTYSEALIVNKRLDLVGSDRATTIVDAGGVGNVVTVSANFVHFEGFSLSNAGASSWGISMTSVEHCNISDVTINTGNGGILILYNGLHWIKDCSITANYALQFEATTGSSYIEGCTLIGNTAGMNLLNSVGNTFENNTFRSLTDGTYIESSDSNTFLGNTFRESNVGVYIDSGIGNVFYHNNFLMNNVPAWDSGTNIWNQPMPVGGNHWSDLRYPDDNIDSIVDNPWLFSGTQDSLPWARQDGWVASECIMIHNAWELQNMTNDLTASYSLANDIDASITSTWNSGAGFEPIGFNGNSFTGILDGCGHKITGLRIARTPSIYGIGLFGRIEVGGTVYNLGLESVLINGGTFGSGALVGSCSGSITRCYSTGSVSGSTFSYVGGLVGYLAPGGSVTNSYSHAGTNGADDVGGFIGRAWGYVSKCYSTGRPNSGTNRGGLAGTNYDVVINSFYDRETSGMTDSGKGDPKFTAEMKAQATFTSAGWDFTTVWQIEEGVTYPSLRQSGGGYQPMRGVAWDAFHGRFIVCGQTGTNSSVSAVFPHQINTMLALPNTPALSFNALAVDNIGNILVGGNDLNGLYYYNSTSETWNIVVENNTGSMMGWNVTAITFNSVDKRFYLVGNVKTQDKAVTFFTDVAPLSPGEKCYRDTSAFMNSPGQPGLRSIEWNPVRNYALAVGGGVYRLDPYNGTPGTELNWATIKADGNDNYYYDISWDSNGWNEAGIVGKNQTFGNYWRYYHTNPQLLQGHRDANTGTKYRTCAMKPPASPKWLFIPHVDGGIKISIMEKDQSGEVTVTSEYPHIFSVGMWKQSDSLQLPTFETQVEVDAAYTFFIECNYTRNGVDRWDTSLGIYFQGWIDNGNIGLASVPGDETGNNRTRQFNISYNPVLGAASLNYPDTSLGVEEFAIASFWEDPVTYGVDNSHHRLYLNVTFGPQTAMAPGDGAWNSGNRWDVNSLNDPLTWDLKTLLYDTGLPSAYNASYDEFGIQRYAALSVSGNPSGSIPPGSSAILATPSQIIYSSNTPYRLNVSVPNLLGVGNPLKFIGADNISVLNEQADANSTNSDVWAWTQFSAPNDDLCIWGLESGTYISPPGNGTVTAGPLYSDFTAAPGVFQPTTLRWQVTVPVGTSEGVYRATITIIIWS